MTTGLQEIVEASSITKQILEPFSIICEQTLNFISDAMCPTILEAVLLECRLYYETSTNK